MTEERAINEYLLEPGDLTGLRMTVRRSAHEMDPPHRVYWRCECYLAAGLILCSITFIVRKDIEARAVLKWGSLEKVELEKEVRETDTDEAHFPIYKRYLLEKYREVGGDSINWLNWL